MARALTVGSVVRTLLLADCHKRPELRSRCIGFVEKNHGAVYKTEAWKKLKEFSKELFEEVVGKVSTSTTKKEEEEKVPGQMEEQTTKDVVVVVGGGGGGGGENNSAPEADAPDVPSPSCGHVDGKTTASASQPQVAAGQAVPPSPGQPMQHPQMAQRPQMMQQLQMMQQQELLKQQQQLAQQMGMLGGMGGMGGIDQKTLQMLGMGGLDPKMLSGAGLDQQAQLMAQQQALGLLG